MFIDVASLNGWIELVLGAELGLSDSPNGLHGFDEVLGQLTFTPTIELGFGLAAEIDLLFAEATVWSYSDSICIGGCSANRFRAGGPLLAGGNDPIPLSAVVSPHPQIVTVPDSDSAMYVQVVETADQNNPTEFVSNLAFSTRDAGGWSPQSIVTQSNSLTRPRLAYTNDGTGTDSAVVVYETSDFTGDLSGLTLNQALTASEIRYRYWDGTAWTAESSVTNNNVADGDVAIAFSGAGDGVLAWT